MVFILIVVLLVLLGFLVWGWDRVDLRDAQGRLLNRKIQLKSADEVAYVRFASVYRQFKDINTFMSELNKLLNEK